MVSSALICGSATPTASAATGAIAKVFAGDIIIIVSSNDAESAR